MSGLLSAENVWLAAVLDFEPDAWVVGDKPCDTELGRGIGAKTILVRTGYGVSTKGKTFGPTLSSMTSWQRPT
jgi:phosphoglycolate phosphatase-like HAD superfamily hydrolase